MGLFGPVLGSWSGEGSRKGGEVVSVVGRGFGPNNLYGVAGNQLFGPLASKGFSSVKQKILL